MKIQFIKNCVDCGHSYVGNIGVICWKTKKKLVDWNNTIDVDCPLEDYCQSEVIE